MLFTSNGFFLSSAAFGVPLFDVGYFRDVQSATFSHSMFIRYTFSRWTVQSVILSRSTLSISTFSCSMFSRWTFSHSMFSKWIVSRGIEILHVSDNSLASRNQPAGFSLLAELNSLWQEINSLRATHPILTWLLAVLGYLYVPAHCLVDRWLFLISGAFLSGHQIVPLQAHWLGYRNVLQKVSLDWRCSLF